MVGLALGHPTANRACQDWDKISKKKTGWFIETLKVAVSLLTSRTTTVPYLFLRHHWSGQWESNPHD